MPNLANQSLCVGCSGCANICPKRCIGMEKDSAGFKYPVMIQPVSCIECGMCENTCPVLGDNIKINGALTSAYAAFAKNESTRHDSSSGGVFTEIAKRIIAQKGVIYGAAYDEKFAVYHYCVDKIDNLQKLRGELDKLLTRKIEEPSLDVTVEGKGVVTAVIELLHGQDVRNI